MKKLVFCFIALLLCSFVIKAQSAASAHESYAKWKATALERLGNDNSIHYSLSTLTQRVDKQTARVNFVVVGQMPSANLEIRPLRVQKGVNGQMSLQFVGESVQTRQELASFKSDLNPTAELSTTVPVDGSANAIEIEWKFDARGEERSYKMILTLDETPTANTLGVIPSDASNLIPLCRKGCYEVSGNSGSCGFFYKCCGSMTGNHIDFTTCRITCGQECGGIE